MRGGNIGHYSVEVRKLLSQLHENDFLIEENKTGTLKIYRKGQPFYSFHADEKGINALKQWIKRTYKIDLFGRQEKNLSKRAQRSQLTDKIQILESQLAYEKRQWKDLVEWLEVKYEDVWYSWLDKLEANAENGDEEI